MERIRYITADGKKILFIDLSNCRASEVAQIAQTVPDHVMRLPRSSVLLLVDFAGASFDPETIRTVKETAVFDKPYIKKAAWIGSGTTLDSLATQIGHFSRRQFPIFNGFQEAVTWLIRD
ncbi:MAG TPA: hypothetical protein VJP02_31690 [Candidatus Sulfotelmatobacter sp.]|nr:hypothetical protein [Candidatus Sulfotelmatobacter sp.]